jgi:hypothetical protein
VAAETLSTAMRCLQLRRQEVSMVSSGKASAATEFRLPPDFALAMPHLHTLVLVGIRIRNKHLIRLLQCCPALEDVQLHTSELSLTVLCALAQHRQLRRLCMESCRLWLYGDPAVLTCLHQLTANGEQQPRAFSALRFLRIHWKRAVGEDYTFLASPSAQELPPLLLAALRHASLRHLHLGLPYDRSRLHLFSPLKQLRVLSVPYDAGVEAMAAGLCLPRPPARDPDCGFLHIHCQCMSQWTEPSRREMWDDDGGVGDEVASDLRMAEEEMRLSRKEPDHVVLVFKDGDESAAFFARAVEERAASGTILLFEP